MFPIGKIGKFDELIVNKNGGGLSYIDGVVGGRLG